MTMDQTISAEWANVSRKQKRSDADIIYGCPRCFSELKQAKDYMRHAKQTCYATEVFRCSSCPKKFTRKHRFQRHHKQAHPDMCKADKCRHDQLALKGSPEKSAFGCGFCGVLFENDFQNYLRHTVCHFRQGATLKQWSYDRQLLALLSQSRLIQLWQSTCAAIGLTNDHLTELSWTKDTARNAIHRLESEPSSEVLPAIFQNLLQAAEVTSPGLRPDDGSQTAASTPCPVSPRIFGPIFMGASHHSFLHIDGDSAFGDDKHNATNSPYLTIQDYSWEESDSYPYSKCAPDKVGGGLAGVGTQFGDSALLNANMAFDLPAVQTAPWLSPSIDNTTTGEDIGLSHYPTAFDGSCSMPWMR